VKEVFMIETLSKKKEEVRFVKRPVVADPRMGALPQIKLRGKIGIITIELFDDRPYVIKFEGKITGNDLRITWNYLTKAYRVWNNNQLKQASSIKLEDTKQGV
jgi:hypothetical protein